MALVDCPTIRNGAEYDSAHPVDGISHILERVASIIKEPGTPSLDCFEVRTSVSGCCILSVQRLSFLRISLFRARRSRRDRIFQLLFKLVQFLQRPCDFADG
jgi:hypothetical protein